MESIHAKYERSGSKNARAVNNFSSVGRAPSIAFYGQFDQRIINNIDMTKNFKHVNVEVPLY